MKVFALWVGLFVTSILFAPNDADAGDTLSSHDVMKKTIDVSAQYSLVRMSKDSKTLSKAANGLLEAINENKIGGIYQEDQQAPALAAREMGTYWWKLIPKGQDVAVVQSKSKGTLIVLDKDIVSNRAKVDAALLNGYTQLLPLITSKIKSAKSCKNLDPLTPVERAECVKYMALQWAGQGNIAMSHLLALAVVNSTTGLSALAVKALKTHFKIDFKKELKKNRTDLIQKLLTLQIAFIQVATTLADSGNKFKNDPTSATCGKNFPPACGIYQQNIYFTSAFAHSTSSSKPGFGRTCLAAMDLHETVHIFDSLSGQPKAHISEFDSKYNTQKQADAMHNPSAFNSFGQQVCYNQDTRFGAGRSKRNVPGQGKNVEVRHIDVPPSATCGKL